MLRIKNLFLLASFALLQSLAVSGCDNDKAKNKSENSNTKADLRPVLELSWQRKYEEALKAVDEAIAGHPRDKVALATRGQILCALGRGREAIQSFDKATSIDPGYAEAYVFKGFTHMELGNEIASRYAFRSAYESYKKRPISVDAYSGRAIALYFLGKKEDALSEINKATEIFTDNMSINMLSGLKDVIESDNRDALIPPFAKKLRRDDEPPWEESNVFPESDEPHAEIQPSE